MVELNELAEAVLAMRTAQKNYFRTRQAKWLSESKEREALVDRMLIQLAPVSVAIADQVARQGTLFD